MSTHRESARVLVRRLNAPQVCLHPPILQNAIGSGLKRGDVLVVGGPAGSGKTYWTNRIAAMHLVNGGAVTFLFAPGSSGFNIRRFMEYLEAASLISVQQRMHGDTLKGDSISSSGLSSGGDNVKQSYDVEFRRGTLLEALNRLTVVHCMDINDLAVYCMHGRVVATSEGHEAVPLLIVEGCCGKGSYLHHLERAIGHQVPLCHWLFGCLQRRSRCALILTEEWAATTGDSSAVGSAVSNWRKRSSSNQSEMSSLPTASIVERESHILQSLQDEAAPAGDALGKVDGKCGEVGVGESAEGASSLPPNNFTTAASRVCSISNYGGTTPPLPFTATSNTNGRQRTTNESFSFTRSLRFFYLYIQTSLAPSPAPTVSTRGNVLIGRLLQWHSVDPFSTGAGASGSSNAMGECGQERMVRQQQQQHQKREKTSRLRGEVLCGVQL
uniref:Uncharacterized protein n=1 Tax=Trypanosoma congolense (strain IL3000) TaxID=1068625 RepID=G0UPQ8_TRYCI|nr:conserved hypothetical protein [Trypanosoma congolense IL3000]